MGKYLKTHVIEGMAATCAHFVPLPSGSTPHTRGVRYFVPIAAFSSIHGAMDRIADGSKRHIRIVVRPSRFRKGLHELYTYHIPKQWSKGCQANRELIKEAQRQAHALEHDHSYIALEYRMRFLSHYFRVFRGGEKPAEGMKAYSRFYQYTYVTIYRALQAARQLQQEEDEVTFEPIVPRYHKTSGSSVHESLFGSTSDAACPLDIPPKQPYSRAKHIEFYSILRKNSRKTCIYAFFVVPLRPKLGSTRKKSNIRYEYNR